MNIIIKMVYGSHLYGTDTPESDRDWIGVYLPSWEDTVLQRVKKSVSLGAVKLSHGVKNTSADIDTTFFSLQEFVKLACEGQTIALDMLHASIEQWAIPEGALLHGAKGTGILWEVASPKHTYPIWTKIVSERSRFYTKSLTAFVGYARKQAAKYGLKGSRLSDLKTVIEFLKRVKWARTTKLGDVWDELPILEHTQFSKIPVEGPAAKIFYVVLGRRFERAVQIDYVIEQLEVVRNKYGERAEAAEQSEGVDWKAVSHALRAASQAVELLRHHTITFPRPDAVYLKAVKSGALHYPPVQLRLEMLMEEITGLQKKSTLPEVADRAYWDQFTLDTYEEERK